MKKFNIYYLLFLGLVLIMAGCQGDNFDITETEVTTSEPTEHDPVGITGKVIGSSGEAIALAEILIVQDEKEVIVTTDENGDYELELPDLTAKLYLQATATDYVTSSITSIDLSEEEATKNFSLLQQEELYYQGRVTALTAGNSFATLSGQILKKDLSPAAFYPVILFDLNQVLSNPTDFVFTYAVTDADGYYSISHEPFENFALITHDDCLNAFELIQAELSMDMEDVELGVHTTNIGQAVSHSISGFVTDCETDEGLTTGRVKVVFDDNEFEAEIVNGVYNLDISNCTEATCFNVSIFGEGAVRSFNTLDCISFSDADITLDHTICGDERTGEGEIRILVGNDSLIYNTPIASIEGSGQLEGYSISNIADAGGNSIAILSDGLDVGTHNTILLVIRQNGERTYTAFTNNVEFVILSIDDYITGSIDGIVLDSMDNEVNISGTFDIKL